MTMVTDGIDFNIWFAHRFVVEQGDIAAGRNVRGQGRVVPRAPLQTLPLLYAIFETDTRRNSNDISPQVRLLLQQVEVVSHDERFETYFELPRWPYKVRRHFANGDGSSRKSALDDAVVLDAALRTELHWYNGNIRELK